MAYGLRVELLGDVRVLRDDGELEISSAHRRAVLAVLAMTPGQAVSRADLIDAVWGDRPPASANGSIYTYVSSLRRVLDPDRTGRGGILSSVGSGYALSLPSSAIDVHVFHEHRERAHALRSSGDLEGAHRELTAALRLWRGEPFARLPGPFAERQRARLNELRTAVIERRADIALTLGMGADVLGELRELIARNPLREAPYVLLMTALSGAGRTTEALQVYDDARRTLIEEAGTEPGAALRAAHDELVGARAGAVVRTTSPAPERPALLVGRENEQAVLRDLLERLHAGHGDTLLVEGEAGIGKTALLAEAFSNEPADVRVCWGYGDELDRRYPLRVLADCLGLDASDIDGDRVLARIAEACERSPVAIVVDDLQWADDTSLATWPRLHAMTSRLPLLLVGTVRPVPERDELAAIRAGSHPVLRLGPIPDRAVRRLVGELAGGVPGPGLTALASQAAGNPFYLRRLLDSLLTEGLLTTETETAELADAAAADVVPQALATSVATHLGYLSTPTRDFLRWAALLGREFTVDDIVNSLERPASELTAQLAESRAAGLLDESDGTLTFRHPLVRRVLRLATPGAVRVVVHRQLAESFANSGAPVDKVAEQLAEAVSVDSWVVEWLTAHADELATDSPTLAARLFRLVLGEPSLATSTRATLADALARLRLLSQASVAVLATERNAQ